MSDTTLQTVRLARGVHASPAEGACVMELASMLAGESFSDRPRAVCPVIAGFLRSYNDRLPPAELDELYRIAALVVGSASTWRVRRARAQRLREWTPAAFRPGRFDARARIVVTAAQAAVRLEPDARRAAVSDLVSELVDLGRRPRPGDRPALAPGAARSRSEDRSSASRVSAGT
jgi:hypothetical protein